jgi:hypothetical protein
LPYIYVDDSYLLCLGRDGKEEEKQKGEGIGSGALFHRLFSIKKGSAIEG